MAGVDQPNVIDLVGQDASGRVLVIMIESRMWGAEAAQSLQLKTKIDNYVAFILNGQLTRHYPQVTGRQVLIQLNCQELPNGEFAEIIDNARAHLLQFNIGILVNVRPVDAGK